MSWTEKDDRAAINSAIKAELSRIPGIPIRKFLAAVALVVVVGLGIGIFAKFNSRQPDPTPNNPAILAQSPAMPAPPLIDYRPVPQAIIPVYAAARNAMIAAGVAEDKVDGPAADLEAAINDAIHKQTDGPRWFGKIAIASLVPLWIIALVALFRHQRVRVDLAHLEETIRQANRIVPPPANDDAITPFVLRR